MTLAGLTLPELSQYDPPVAGEGSLDPMGLAAISDRLADRLVPGLRARMQRIRFITAMAVGAMACDALANEVSSDGISTPAICFEWLVIEGFVRRLSPQQIPSGVPGSQKARAVVKRKQRLSASTYLKGPTVFGFNGVYKPFAVDSSVVGNELEPGPRCAELVRAWELEQGFAGFADAVPGTDGGKLRAHIRDQVHAALREGRCTANPGTWLFGRLTESLHPDHAWAGERSTLRSLVTSGEHETRAELASLLVGVEDTLSETELLDAVRPRCSRSLGSVVDAVVAYERFAVLVDAAFRTLCAISHSMGAQPLTPHHVEMNDTIVRCSRELPGYYRTAADRVEVIGSDGRLEDRLGEFAIRRSPGELVELLLEHHERIQAAKLPNGKRPWFEPLRNGWVVRSPYGTPEQPELGSAFVHPVRVTALHNFLQDTKP
jgi:hypothetical protein